MFDRKTDDSVAPNNKKKNPAVLIRMNRIPVNVRKRRFTDKFRLTCFWFRARRTIRLNCPPCVAGVYGVSRIFLYRIAGTWLISLVSNAIFYGFSVGNTIADGPFGLISGNRNFHFGEDLSSARKDRGCRLVNRSRA